MASSLNIIALISGGKDSLFSMLHCLANGHTIVALANLYPPPSDDEDMNSYMYQTVGHSVIPLYEEALGIPLYREEIRGSAVNSSRDYSQAAEDETESLMPLLRRVKEAHPEANALSTGAIFSTYQRTRVESVALRLGLTPLSYLWQFPFLPPYTQSSLLHDMEAVGQDARIIKVASGGLDESFLWANVADSETVARMKKALGRFSEAGDGSLLGEGGEFETLAIEGPSLLWRKRIVLEQDHIHRGEGGIAIWQAKTASLVDKSPDTFSLDNLRIPPLFDVEFLKILEADLPPPPAVMPFPFPSRGTPVDTNLPINEHWDSEFALILANIAGDKSSKVPHCGKTQLKTIFARLSKALRRANLPKTNIVHCTLLLKDMADFAWVNKAYAKYFDYTNPPARVTVAVGMPSGFKVMLSAVVEKKGRAEALHVQGQSYWAPANIGPYSQGVASELPVTSHHVVTSAEALQGAGRVVYLAGQIPLEPASMRLLQHKAYGFKGEALLALQHLWRIGRTMSVRWWISGVALIPSTPTDPAQPCEKDPKTQEQRVQLVQSIWKAIHTIPEDMDDADYGDVDPWDLRNRHSAFHDTSLRIPPCPDRNAVSSLDPNVLHPIPPCWVAEVESLPRSANVEWVATGLTSDPIYVSAPDVLSLNMTTTEPDMRKTATRFHTFEITYEPDDFHAICLLGPYSQATLYASERFHWDCLRMSGVQFVPCKRVWGDGGREVKGVVVARADEKIDIWRRPIYRIR